MEQKLRKNPSYIFRMIHKNNIDTFIQDGFLCAPNYQIQKQYSISYQEINAQRSTMTVHNDKPLHDYVPFYFSPLTPMSYAISLGKVNYQGPGNNTVEKLNDSDTIFFVVDLKILATKKYQTIVSNSACNNFKFHTFNTIKEAEIDWDLFNEDPIKARIKEIDYLGACQYFFDKDTQKYHNRKAIRGAEFLILDKINFEDIHYILVKDDRTKTEIENKLYKKGINTVVLVTPNCYF